MKSHPKIIDRILETIRQSQTICVGRPCPPRRRLHRLANRPEPGFAQAGQGSRPVGTKIVVPQKYAFLDPNHLLQKPDRAAGLRSGHCHRLRVLRALGQCRPPPPRRKCLINIDHHQSNTRYGDLNWISAREASTGELIFRLIAGRPLADHPGDCRLPFHRRLDRYRVLPICHDQAGDLSHGRRIGEIGRARGNDLPRGLSILFPFARPPAQTRLITISIWRTTTRSPTCG